MPLPKPNTYTVEDIYLLPEGQRAELIDGLIYNMAPSETCCIIYYRSSKLSQIKWRFL